MSSASQRGPSTGRLLFRLCVGGASLGSEQLGRRLVDWSEAARAQTGLEAPARPGRQALVGALALAPARARGLQREVRAWLDVLARPLVEGAAAAARATRAGQRLEASLSELQRGWARRLRRWAEVGRREETAGRALAREALQRSLAAGMDWAAANPSLQEVVKQQSAGLGRTAVDELRGGGARADLLADRLAQRLLGHGEGSGPGEPH
jgi:hypothetical protein